MDNYLIQIVGSAFVLFAWSRVFLRYRDDTLSLWGLLFWSLIWIAVLVVLFLPHMTDLIAERLGIGRGVDVFIYSSIVVLFYLVYRVYVKIESIEQEITKVVREESLHDLKKKK
ncbi:DUF2304 family protein [Patescibacteria group bacterium]|nr:DUF2304 family protein [Patescibacteria group bacterium]